MAEVWPVALQQLLNESSFGYSFGETTIRSKNDTGLDKVRRTSTRPIDKISATINITVAQFSVLKTFYDTTINGGVTRFSFNHPITGVSSEYRFLSPPQLRSIGGSNFITTLEWEVMP